MATVKEIVEGWLIDRGYEGLLDADGDCACDLADLMACGESCPDCEPGYRVAPDAGDDEHAFCIQAERPRGGG